jgi:hypothetical protein
VVVQGVFGFILSRAIYVAAKLGVADRLAAGPMTAEELADASGADAAALARILRTLVSAGIFARTDDGRCELNEPARLLCADVPGSLRSLVLYYGELSYRAWGEVMHSARTGEPAFDRVFGAGFWAYLEQDPAAAAVFNGAMRGGAASRGAALEGYGWRGDETVVDLGGGDGSLLIDLLSRHKGLRGVVVDLPHAAGAARARIADAGLDARCTAVAGDLFGDLPHDGDVYVLAIVLHDWDDERAAAIVANCRRAMGDDAVLLLIEFVMPDGDAPHVGRLIDLHMLVETGGRERTEAEWRALLEAGGFRLMRVIPGEPWCALEARPL